MSTTSNSTSGELSFTLRGDIKDQVEFAAKALGISVNEYATRVLTESSDRLIHGNRITKLSARDSEILLRALDAPDPPLNQELLAAIKDYKTRVVSHD